MFESYDTQKRRKAIALVLEEKLTPSQVARALNYTARAVRLWVREYLDLHPTGHLPESSYAPAALEVVSQDDKAESPSEPFSFLPLVLDNPKVAEPQSISVEIVTASGHAVRLGVRSVEEAAELIRTLEEDRC